LQGLEGIRIVVTRAAHQAEELAAPFRALGANVILLPVIEIGPPLDREPLRAAAANCHQYDWIVFTSSNALSAFADELPFTASACTARVAAVGAATREAAEARGFRVSLTPEEYVAESLVEAFDSEEMSGRRVLIPSAAITRDVVAERLSKRGARVEMVEAYRNVIPNRAARRVPDVFRDPYPDWVTFASSSAVNNLVKLAGAEVLSRVKIASIGPITTGAVRKHELSVAAEASPHSVEGLVQAVASFKTSL
jgi:uroporphyrinogen-III synthase